MSAFFCRANCWVIVSRYHSNGTNNVIENSNSSLTCTFSERLAGASTREHTALSSGQRFMTDLLVSSLMADGGLEAALCHSFRQETQQMEELKVLSSSLVRFRTKTHKRCVCGICGLIRFSHLARFGSKVRHTSINKIVAAVSLGIAYSDSVMFCCAGERRRKEDRLGQTRGGGGRCQSGGVDEADGGGGGSARGREFHSAAATRPAAAQVREASPENNTVRALNKSSSSDHQFATYLIVLQARVTLRHSKLILSETTTNSLCWGGDDV